MRRCVPNVGYSQGGSTGPALAATIDPIATQTAIVAVPLNVEVVNGAPPYTYAWTVAGSTDGISNPTAKSPTWTVQQDGDVTAACTVTDARLNSVTAVRTFTVDIPFALAFNAVLIVSPANAVPFDVTTYTTYPGTIGLP